MHGHLIVCVDFVYFSVKYNASSNPLLTMIWQKQKTSCMKKVSIEIPLGYP